MTGPRTTPPVPAAPAVCPSCKGRGWVAIRVSGITVASGLCRCKGGFTWAK